VLESFQSVLVGVFGLGHSKVCVLLSPPNIWQRNMLKWAEKLPPALFEKLDSSFSIVRDRRQFAEYKVRVLEERLRLVRIEKYGPGSEKLSDDQLELLELEPGVSSAEVEAESHRGQLQLPLKAAHKHPGRQGLPPELPRTEQIIVCTPEQCVCGKCGPGMRWAAEA
jgi:hypothetical protein